MNEKYIRFLKLTKEIISSPDAKIINHDSRNLDEPVNFIYSAMNRRGSTINCRTLAKLIDKLIDEDNINQAEIADLKVKLDFFRENYEAVVKSIQKDNIPKAPPECDRGITDNICMHCPRLGYCE